MNDISAINRHWMRQTELGEGIDLSAEELLALHNIGAGKLIAMHAVDDGSDPAVPLACSHCDPFIYFLQAESGGPVKIGLTAKPHARRIEHQTSHPDRLCYIALFHAPSYCEGQLHKHFLPEWLRGEWHFPSIRLIRFAEKMGVQ